MLSFFPSLSLVSLSPAWAPCRSAWAKTKGCFSVLEPTQSLLLKGEGHSGRFDFRGTTSVLTLDGWPDRQGSQTTETCANPPEYQSPRRGVHVVSISIQFRADFRDSARPERKGSPRS